MKKAGLIASARGSQTVAIQLIRPIESITIYDIIALMETNTSIVNTQDERDPMKRILMREVWSLIDDNLKAYLSDLTIAELSLSLKRCTQAYFFKNSTFHKDGVLVCTNST